MPTKRIVPALALGVALITAAPVSAADDHDTDAGGAAAPGMPEVTRATCDRARTCASAETLTITGEDLEAVDRVTFLGRKGWRDDRAVRPATRSAHAVAVLVPPSARSGPVRVETASERRRVGRIRIVTRRTPAATTVGFTFPIDGMFEIGTTVGQRFGGPRGHQGQDILSPCGTPVVVPTAGTVSTVKQQSAAGNYVVIDGADGRSYALMHLLQPSTLRRGDTVAAGDPVGAVGQTGRASACMLHLELWTAPGWYSGGSAIDPYRELRLWQRAA